RPDVLVLGAPRHVHPGDVDGAELLVVAEADGLDLGGAVEGDGGQLPVPLGGEETLLCLGECHSSDGRTSSEVQVNGGPPGSVLPCASELSWRGSTTRG